MELKPLVNGLITWTPGFYPLRKVLGKPGTGGTNSARYCYSVWLRHLTKAAESSLNTHPEVIAELGPGDSIGIGLAALLSGATTYYGLDVIEHAGLQRNLAIFDELVELFRSQAPIPDEREWPLIHPTLRDYRFPSGILDEGRLRASLNPSRIERIRDELQGKAGDGPRLIRYTAPWHQSERIEKHVVDMIFSQAVLEHVDDLEFTYRRFAEWLKPNGYLSHQIDFKSHGTSRHWNGHWRYKPLEWRVIRGGQPYLLNRQPWSTHLKALAAAGFRPIKVEKKKMSSRFGRGEVAPEFAGISDEDFETSSVFVQASR